MKLDAGAFLSLLPKLGSALDAGATFYGAARASGLPITADDVANHVAEFLSGWHPSIKGKTILDTPTKAALCRFLAGVTFNLSK